MVNFNGNIQENSNFSIESNRGFLYGDAIFETIKVLDNKVLFLEDHYFRLMASMRICRMEIPMNFTMEFFEEQILKLTNSLEKSNSFRVRFSVFRNSDGFYTPISNEIHIEAKRIENVPGTHSIFYDSEVDQIEIKHTAHSREGFALGAVVAAEWLVGKKGVFTMKDVLGLNSK